MKRSICLGLAALFIIAAPLAFSFECIDLPEPVFKKANTEQTQVYTGPAGLWLHNFDEVVYYLWNFNSVETPSMVILPNAAFAQATLSDTSIPQSIRNNRFFVESVRLTNLAQKAFEDGDYDASRKYSQEAVKFAIQSDEFVALQLKIRETDNAIATAKARLDWASSSAVDAARRYPNEFTQAQSAYNEARTLRSGEKWDQAIAAASRVINSLAMVTEAPPPPPPPPPPPAPAAPPPVQQPVVPSVYPLPAQYTVRPWAVSKDCLWNIAGRPWAYNDPNQWRLLYNANKAKMPQPNNPDLIHPGFVLDIPSIRGETREGMWTEGRNYVPLK